MNTFTHKPLKFVSGYNKSIHPPSSIFDQQSVHYEPNTNMTDDKAQSYFETSGRKKSNIKFNSRISDRNLHDKTPSRNESLRTQSEFRIDDYTKYPKFAGG